MNQLHEMLQVTKAPSHITQWNSYWFSVSLCFCKLSEEYYIDYSNWSSRHPLFDFRSDEVFPFAIPGYLWETPVSMFYGD